MIRLEVQVEGRGVNKYGAIRPNGESRSDGSKGSGTTSSSKRFGTGKIGVWNQDEGEWRRVRVKSDAIGKYGQYFGVLIWFPKVASPKERRV